MAAAVARVGADAASPTLLRTEFRAFGCTIRAMVDREDPATASALQRVPSWFESWEDRLSRFRPHSELSRLNRRRGRWTRVSPTLWTVARHALRAARISDRLVLPTLLDDLVRAGYDRPFEQLLTSPHHPPPPPVPPATSPFPRPGIRLLKRSHLLYLPRKGGLDLAGVAKAWAAAEAARRLAPLGPSLVDAGGDVAVTAPPRDSPGWPVAVSLPHEPEPRELVLSRGGVATSGREYRHWSRPGRPGRPGHPDRPAHHVIDPRTGEPAATDLLTATVIAPTLLEADVTARAALILGRDRASAWLTARPHLTWLLATEDGVTVSGPSNLETPSMPAPPRTTASTSPQTS